MLVKHKAVAIVCAADGSATVWTTGPIKGRIVGIFYTQGTIDNGATLTFTGKDSGTPIVAIAGNASSPVYPRTPVVNGSNVAITNSWDYVRLFEEQIKCVVASGGNATAGAFWVLTEEGLR